jgi:hypothetical protein
LWALSDTNVSFFLDFLDVDGFEIPFFVNILSSLYFFFYFLLLEFSWGIFSSSISLTTIGSICYYT